MKSVLTGKVLILALYLENRMIRTFKMGRIMDVLRWWGMICLFVCVAIWSMTGCYDEKFTTDPADQLSFSEDTLTFDTVFTAISTVTRFFKVYNPHSLSIEIEEIKLVGPNAQFFRLNADGRSGDVIRNIIIAPNDSIYVFAEATIDPDQPESVSPFIIETDVVFTTNSTEQKVLLLAWGQNANYIPGPHTPNRISLLSCQLGEVVWDDPKPYVLYGTLLIDSCTLVLPPGTRLYVHGGIANNDIGIYNEGLIYTLPHGKINVSGTVDNPVVIRDDRIEPDHEGEWAGIRLGPGSGPHNFSYCAITNGIVGISADSATTLSVDHSVISFTSGPGIFARHATVSVSNSLFYENGSQAIALTYGGTYDITYCTMANFGNDREAMLLNNFYCTDLLCSEGIQFNKIQGRVINSIIVGSSTDELWMVDAAEPPGEMFDVMMNNNIVVVDELLDPDNFPSFFETVCMGCFEYMFGDTLFVDVAMHNYHLDTASVAEMKAVPVPGIPDDLDNKLRGAVKPDIGCYEFQ